MFCITHAHTHQWSFAEFLKCVFHQFNVSVFRLWFILWRMVKLMVPAKAFHLTKKKWIEKAIYILKHLFEIANYMIRNTLYIKITLVMFM